MSLALGHRVKKDIVSTLKEIVVLGNRNTIIINFMLEMCKNGFEGDRGGSDQFNEPHVLWKR